MDQAKDGCTVKVHYTGKLEDGTVFDSSREREPFKLTLGNAQVISGFEQGIMGMEVGQTKTVKLPPDQAYGAYRDDLKVDVHKADFPQNITPEMGQRLQMKQSDGSTVNLVVTKMDGDNVTLDANHPLAGKTLIFEIELLEIA
jgi:FKBP-type peptidyl-prolyl cis-trans isomerase 2